MKFVNPFDLLDLDASSCPSAVEIRKAKRKKLLEFELSDGGTLKINGQSIQRSDFLRAVEEASGEQKREFYWLLHSQLKKLNRFLVQGSLEFFRGHQYESPYNYSPFVEFVSPYFARQYSRVLRAALKNRNPSRVQLLTSHDPLVTKEHTDRLYHGANQHLRHLREEVERIRQLVKKGESSPPQEISAAVDEAVCKDTLNALPSYLQGERGQLATAIRDLAVAVFNELDDAKAALELLQKASTLKVGEVIARRLRKDLNQIKEIYERRRVTEQHSEVLEQCADAIARLDKLAKEADKESADPTHLLDEAQKVVEVGTLNKLPDALESVRNQVALALRGLATVVWNKHQDAQTAKTLTQLALEIQSGASVREQLKEDSEALQELEKEARRVEREQILQLRGLVSNVRSTIEQHEGVFFSGSRINWFKVEEFIDSVFTTECVRFLEQADDTRLKKKLLVDLSYVLKKLQAHLPSSHSRINKRLLKLVSSGRPKRRTPDRSSKKRKSRGKQKSTSSGKSTSQRKRSATEKDKEALSFLFIITIIFLLLVAWLFATLEQTAGSGGGDSSSKSAIELDDTMHFEVTASDGPVRELRVTVDDDLRRPYWIEKGETKTFAVTNRIVLGPPINATDERPLDALTLRLNGREYPVEQRNADGEVVITRSRAQAFLSGELDASEDNSASTSSILTDQEESGGKGKSEPSPAKPAENVSPYKGNQLSNGASPYDAAFGKGVYDRHDENKLIVKNGQSSDAVVCLVDVYSGQTIRNEYVQAGTEFEMTSIPNGTYYVKTFYGRDWNPGQKILGGRITGGFETDFYYTKSDDDFLYMRDDGYRYSIYEITLYAVEGGNMESEDINASEFFLTET